MAGMTKTLTGRKGPPKRKGKKRKPDKIEPGQPDKGIAGAPEGSGANFAKLKGELAGRKGVRNPGGLAAYIGRKKLGKARFQKLAARGK